MREHKANQTVPGGFYWNKGTWEIVPVNGESGVLPGDSSARYIRVPAALLVVGAPVLGGLFVMFLPFIGIFLALRELARRTGMAFKSAGDEVAVRLAPSWQPGVAHLTGGKETEKKETAEKTSEPSELSALEEKVEERRRTES